MLGPIHAVAHALNIGDGVRPNRRYIHHIRLEQRVDCVLAGDVRNSQRVERRNPFSIPIVCVGFVFYIVP